MINKLLFNVLFILTSTFSFSQKVYSVFIAGSGSTGSNDGSATTASFNRPVGIATNSIGEIYVADFNNHKIRKIDLSGNVTTIAGTGVPGFTDGPALSAQFRNPGGLCVDDLGNVYITDNENNRIRKLDTKGNVTTIAGSGPGFTNGSGAIAKFEHPRDIKLGPNGSLYIVDRDNHSIRIIDKNNMVTTLAGVGYAGFADGHGTTAKFDTPGCIVLDKAGNVYVTDRENNRIRKIDPSKNVTTISGQAFSGSADSSMLMSTFKRPIGLIIVEDSLLYLSDYGNFTIRKINLLEDKVTTYAGTGSMGYKEGEGDEAQFGEIFGLAYNSIDKSIYLTDASAEKIRRLYFGNPLGIENQTSDALKVYPNPTRDIINIHISNINDPYQIVVRDISGRIMFENNDCCGFNAQVDLNNYPAGIYFLELAQNNTLMTKKLIKN